MTFELIIQLRLSTVKVVCQLSAVAQPRDCSMVVCSYSRLKYPADEMPLVLNWDPTNIARHCIYSSSGLQCPCLELTPWVSTAFIGPTLHKTGFTQTQQQALGFPGPPRLWLAAKWLTLPLGFSSSLEGFTDQESTVSPVSFFIIKETNQDQPNEETQRQVWKGHSPKVLCPQDTFTSWHTCVYHQPWSSLELQCRSFLLLGFYYGGVIDQIAIRVRKPGSAAATPQRPSGCSSHVAQSPCPLIMCGWLSGASAPIPNDLA